MKKRLFFLAAIGVLALSACVKEPLITNAPEETDAHVVFSAATESAATRTSLDGNDQDGYTVNWQDGDQITVIAQGPLAHYSTTSTTTRASFTYVDGTESQYGPFQAWYPASIKTSIQMKLPDTQYYVADNIQGFPMYATSNNTNLQFKNLCGIIRLDISTTQSNMKVSTIALSADQGMSGSFTISGDAAVVSGTTGVTLSCSTAVPIGTEPTSFLLAVPEGDYTHFKIKVTTSNGNRQVKTANRTISVTRSKITPITLSFNDLNSDPIDLSATETANCYVVSASEKYKFRATVRGNGAADLNGVSTATGAISRADLLWATYGSWAEIPGDSFLIYNVRWGYDGYVYFSTRDDRFEEGNALIAVKDAGGNILWSWHIWFERDNLDAKAQTYPGSGAVMMDRNLGATSNTSTYGGTEYGFLYEWGRKDPFPNKARVNGGNEWQDIKMKGSSTEITLAGLDIASSIANPTTISSGGISGATWEGDAKNIFDPCPPGWKVPGPEVFDGIKNTGVWTASNGGSFDLGGGVSAWYPAAGLYGHGHLQHYDQGNASCVYTTTTAYAKSFDFTASNSGSMQNKDSYWACSVRCVRDDGSVSYINTNEYTDLGTSGTANCYQIREKGKYKFNATVKGNGSADLADISRTTDKASIIKAELVWASDGTTTAPAADAYIKEIYYKNGYVCFSTGDSYKEGNAVVAIKDAAGNILWSWHLWFESSDLESNKLTYYNGGTFMNCNLGANASSYPGSSVSTDYGLLYQWGRKDPFLNAPVRTGYSSTEAAIYGTARVAKNQLYTVAETILHPTDYPFTYNNTPWMTNEQKNIALWSSTKTIFDPCPAGWKVPQKSSWGDYFIENFTTTAPTQGRGVSVVYTPYGNLTTWFPDAGYRQGVRTKNGETEYIQGLGIIQHRGDSYYFRQWCSDGILWRDTFNGNDFKGLYDYDVDLLASPWFYYGTYRDNACSVRCVKEQ